MDDYDMIEAIRSTKHISFKDLFIPGVSGGSYYRPLIMLSFYLDRFIFGLDSFTMHFHNFVLHLINAMLLYWIAVKVGRRISLDAPFVPLVVALLFLLHPITTESVNWISGRTDILAGTFLLASTGLLFDYLDSGRRWLLYVALFMFMCAVLTKEFSLAFLPGFIWLAAERNSQKHSVKTGIMFALLGVSVVAAFFLLRKLAYTSNASQISTTLMIIFNTPDRSLQLILTAIGFYFKKLFLPMPLNFAIYEVNALYEFAAWPILALLAYIAWKRTLLSVLFLSGFFLVIPALVIVFNQIAWTPFAERYLYFPAAFVTLSTTYYFRINLKFNNNVSRLLVVLLPLCLFAGFTFQRNLTWNTSFGIVSDTVQKSPDSTDMKYQLAGIYFDRGDNVQSRKILATINNPTGLFYDERIDMAEVGILESEGMRGDAIKQLEKVLKNTKNKSHRALIYLIEVYSEEEKKSNGADSLVYRQKIFDIRKKLYKTKRNPALLYDLGQDAAKLGYTEKAKMYFTLATQNIPPADPLHEKSVLALKRLGEVE